MTSEMPNRGKKGKWNSSEGPEYQESRRDSKLVTIIVYRIKGRLPKLVYKRMDIKAGLEMSHCIYVEITTPCLSTGWCSERFVRDKILKRRKGLMLKWTRYDIWKIVTLWLYRIIAVCVMILEAS
ncbi:hypothetical protein L1887_32304 [Cichorium endivia]|nr:hypothetical protein L1887_32304 [Cichorium endivia]